MASDLVTRDARHGRGLLPGKPRPNDSRSRDPSDGTFARTHYPPLPPILAWFLRTRPRNIHTRTYYQQTLDQFNVFALAQGVDVGDPEQITRELVELWLDAQFDRGLSAYTVHARYVAVRALCNWLVEDQELLKRSPLRRMKAPRLPKLVRETYKPEHIAAMRKLCPASRWWGARAWAMLILAVMAGLRRAEISDLDWDDVDFDRGLALIRHGKGDKQRLVGLPEQVIDALYAYGRFRKGDPALFQTQGGVRLSPSGVYQAINELVKRAGVTGNRGVHRGRHTFAKVTLRAGGNLRSLQLALGHEDIKTTQVYLTDIDSEESAADLAQVDAFKRWG